MGRADVGTMAARPVPISDLRLRDVSVQLPELIDGQVNACFWFIAVATILNLNGLIRMGFGIEQFFSLVLLAAALVCILFSRVPLLQCLGVAGLAFMVFIAFYVLFSLITGYARWVEMRYDTSFLLVSYSASFLLIGASAVGACTAIIRLGEERVYARLEKILFISLLAVVFTPLLRAVYILPPDTAAFRFSGTFGNPNTAGTLACVCVALSLARLRTGIGGKFSWICLSVSSVATLATFSRTSILTLATLFAVQFLLPSLTRFRVRLARWLAAASLLIVGLLTLGALTALLKAPEQLERLLGVFRILEGGDLSSVGLAERLVVWNLSLDMIRDAPVLGNGLGSLHEIANAPFNDVNIRLGAHNQYLTVWGEGGILSIGLFAVALGVMAWEALCSRASLTRQFVCTYLFVFAVACMTSNNELTMRYQDFFLGFCCGAVSVHGLNRRRIGS